METAYLAVVLENLKSTESAKSWVKNIAFIVIICEKCEKNEPEGTKYAE
jgi:hypothetical protein